MKAAELPSPTSAIVVVHVGGSECACAGESAGASAGAGAGESESESASAVAIAHTSAVGKRHERNAERYILFVRIKELIALYNWLIRELRVCPASASAELSLRLKKVLAGFAKLLQDCVVMDQDQAMVQAISKFSKQCQPTLKYILHFACQIDSWRCVCKLLDLGFDPRAEDSEGLWPYELAPEGSDSKKHAEDAAIVDFCEGYPSDEDV